MVWSIHSWAKEREEERRKKKEEEEEAMGRPPCCDKVGIKKGPWTPEEDIILVSYIQEHGPGNWRSVPTNTGLLRCSKSCRLRWTNYLRPGIKRGNFTPHEEGMIIHLQALLGNKWAAIASYLPQRTDNDIKNYWNTHLKKKLKKIQSSLDTVAAAAAATQDSSSLSSQFMSKSFTERSRSFDFSLINHHSSSSSSSSASSTTYASSTENISRLLEGWMRSSPKPTNTDDTLKGIGNSLATTSLQSYIRPKADQGIGGGDDGGGDLISNEEFECILSFENLNNVGWEKSTSESTTTVKESASDHQAQKENDGDDSNNNNNNNVEDMKKQKASENNPPLTFLEKWLLDESANCQVDEEEESMQLSPIF